VLVPMEASGEEGRRAGRAAEVYNASRVEVPFYRVGRRGVEAVKVG
jgi:hypothetical protein